MRLTRKPRGVWGDVAALTHWLDEADNKQVRWWWSPSRRRAFRDHRLTLRLAKAGEEIGEVLGARIGQLGQNPRKGVSATGDDVAAEIGDVIVTAMVALIGVTGDVEVARARLDAHAAGVRKRVAA